MDSDMSVVSYGEFRYADNFIHGGIPLNIGYTSECKIVHVAWENFSVNIKCSISIETRSLPLYTCYTDSNHVSDFQVSTCVKKFLEQIRCLG